MLEGKGLWGYVDGSKVLEEDTTDDVKQMFHQESRQAMGEMILNVDTKYVTSELTKNTPKDVSGTLKEMNTSRTTALQATLRRRLISLKKQGTQTIQEYANSINGIENDLAASGYELPKFDKIFALFEGLSQEYETIRSILLERADDERESLTFEQHVERLETK